MATDIAEVAEMPPRVAAIGAASFGAANGSIGVGMALGPALGTFLGGVLMAKIGWREVFVLFGVASLLWLIPWYGSTRSASTQSPRAAAGTVPGLKATFGRRGGPWRLRRESDAVASGWLVEPAPLAQSTRTARATAITW